MPRLKLLALAIFLASVLPLRGADDGVKSSGGSEPVCNHGGLQGLKHLGKILPLCNGVVHLEISPQTGRITHFARTGGENWIDVNDVAVPAGTDWKPWGGDRIWPYLLQLAPQIFGNRFFDPALEDEPWEIRAYTPLASRGTHTDAGTPASITIVSQPSPHLGIRVTRTITLPAGQAAVLHDVLLERLPDPPESLPQQHRGFPLHVWAVTSITQADAILLAYDSRVPQSAYGEPYKWWPSISPQRPDVALLSSAPSALPQEQALLIPWPSPQSGALKVGTYGTWIAALRGGEAFVQSIDYDPRALYLDESSLQAYLEPARGLYEIETLSPSWFLLPGQSRNWKIRWQLMPLHKDFKLPLHKLPPQAQPAHHTTDAP